MKHKHPEYLEVRTVKISLGIIIWVAIFAFFMYVFTPTISKLEGWNAVIFGILILVLVGIMATLIAGTIIFR